MGPMKMIPRTRRPWIFCEMTTKTMIMVGPSSQRSALPSKADYAKLARS